MFSLYDINNKIYIQFCLNTFDNVISFFQCVWIQYPHFSISGSLYYFHIVYQYQQYRFYGRKTHKKELIFISTIYIVVAYGIPGLIGLDSKDNRSNNKMLWFSLSEKSMKNSVNILRFSLKQSGLAFLGNFNIWQY